MKKDLHPTYHSEAKVKCACGNSWVTGSILEEISTGICSKCHPFYTGQEKILDATGRVDKFKKRLERSAAAKAKPKTSKSK